MKINGCYTFPEGSQKYNDQQKPEQKYCMIPFI